MNLSWNNVFSFKVASSSCLKVIPWNFFANQTRRPRCKKKINSAMQIYYSRDIPMLCSSSPQSPWQLSSTKWNHWPHQKIITTVNKNHSEFLSIKLFSYVSTHLTCVTGAFFSQRNLNLVSSDILELWG